MPRAAAGARAGRESRVLPKIVEVEPVVGRAARMRLELAHVALDPGHQRDVARAGAELDALGKHLVMDVVAQLAFVEAEEGDHRHAEHRRRQYRPGGKPGLAAEELASGRALVAERAVAQHGNHLAALEALAHAQQAADFAGPDDAVRELGGHLAQPAAGRARVAFVHHQVDRQLLVALAEGAQDLDAAQVRADQQAAAAAREQRLYRLHPVHADLEARAALRQHLDAVEQRAGEDVEMPEHLPQPDRRGEDAPEVGARGAPRTRREGDEVGADRQQQRTSGAVAQRARDPRHEAHRKQVAALALLEPDRAHGPALICSVPSATSAASPSMRKATRSSAVRSSTMRKRSSGRSSERKLAAGMPSTCRLSPNCSRTARSTSASSHAPGTTGLPGKWPASAGCVAGTLCHSWAAVASAFSASRLSLPAALRGSTSTSTSGRGRNTGSMRSRSCARIAALPMPGATANAVRRGSPAPLAPSGIQNTPSSTPGTLFSSAE